jgi:hypothetical protein
MWRFNGNRRELIMHDQRNLTQDAVLRAQIAIANRLIAEQSAVIARAHSAIERAMESLREPDGEGRPGRCATSGPALLDAGREARKERPSC